jgi:hypothetical protein
MITWNTDVNAPCCPGEIVNDDGRTLLVQSDWDYPGTASSFGWSLQQVQRCAQCDEICETAPDGHAYHCDTLAGECRHEFTDGTVVCPDCGVTEAEFIAAAGAWLREHDGATVHDPGYFDGGDA